MRHQETRIYLCSGQRKTEAKQREQLDEQLLMHAISQFSLQVS